MPIPHKAGRSRWCITGSSRTSASCGPNWPPPAITPKSETDTETVALLAQMHMARGLSPVEGGAGHACQAARRLCPVLSLRWRRRPDHCRPQGQPAGHRPWRGRDVRGLGRDCAFAADRSDHLSGRRRLAVVRRAGAEIFDAEGRRAKPAETRIRSMRRGSRRPATSTSWPRKSPNSRLSWPMRCAIT